MSNAGVLMKKMFGLNEKKTKLNAEIKAIDEELKTIQEKLIEEMDSIGTDQLRSETHTVTVTETEVPNPDDWDAIYKYISRTKSWFLVQRRLNAAPWRDLLEARKGKPIPGISAYKKRSLSVRKTR